MMPVPTDVVRHVAKPIVLVLGLVPLGALVGDAMQEQLGPNPVEAVIHRSGDWALRLLLLTLAVTPLRRMTGWGWLQRFRRMLGLLAFAYASLHAAAYLVLDRGLVGDEIVTDLLKRPYIAFGATAFLLLVPLAATSTRAAMRRLGRHWQRLHRLVYVAAALAVLHFLWLVKVDNLEPLVYGVVLGVLLLARRTRGVGRRGVAAVPGRPA
jgi:sulfoxide reductase heme-binding subunit YedZ